MQRANWEEYFMNIAKEVATRSTCDRKHVGSLIIRDKTILSTGYNPISFYFKESLNKPYGCIWFENFNTGLTVAFRHWIKELNHLYHLNLVHWAYPPSV